MHTARAYLRDDGTTAYRIGYFDPAAKKEAWQILGELTDPADAMAYVSYLNGGAKPPGQLPSMAPPRE